MAARDGPRRLAAFLDAWGLLADGEPIVTPHARLLPVRRGSRALMLKVALNENEARGGAVLAWWNGDGAARVLEHEPGVTLIERAGGLGDLAAMARGERDEEATRVLCGVVRRLHAPRPAPPPPLPSLHRAARDLFALAPSAGGPFLRAAGAARALLAEPQDVVALHGDVHHGNVLDFGPRGWLAIDPKGFWGERTYDYCNLFTNPDLIDPSRPVATDPERFARRLGVVTADAGLDRGRLLLWLVAWSGVCAAWYVVDGEPRLADIPLAVGRLAAAELDR